jgi:hypothetical protein
MSSIPTPASIPEALDMIDNAMSYFDSPDFMALPAETRIKCLDQVTTIARAVKAQALTEYVRRRWDGTVRWAYERPMTGSMKVSWSGVRAARKS